MAKMANAATMPNYASAKGGSGTTAGLYMLFQGPSDFWNS